MPEEHQISESNKTLTGLAGQIGLTYSDKKLPQSLQMDGPVLSVIKNIIEIVLSLAQAFVKFPHDSAECGWGIHEAKEHRSEPE